MGIFGFEHKNGYRCWQQLGGTSLRGIMLAGGQYRRTAAMWFRFLVTSSFKWPFIWEPAHRSRSPMNIDEEA
jgi:hypothetical protein